MSGDPEAVEKTAQKLGIPAEDVQAALRVAEVYRSIHGNLKHERRQRGLEAVAKQRVAEDKRKQPERCFCKEEGLAVERGYEADGIVDYIAMYTPLDHYHKNGWMEPRFRCTNCGKLYIREQPAFG